MKKIKWTELLLFVVVTELVGFLSSLVAGGDFKEHYADMSKPPLAPPGWLFPIVWAGLFALMGIAAYLVSVSESSLRRRALTLYFAQLFVNFLWTPVFFGLGSYIGAVAVIFVLLILVSAMTAVFYRVRPAASYLVLPYLLWTIYAAYLTVAFAVVNA